jgi:hypothetical protein
MGTGWGHGKGKGGRLRERVAISSIGHYGPPTTHEESRGEPWVRHAHGYRARPLWRAWRGPHSICNIRARGHDRSDAFEVEGRHRGKWRSPEYGNERLGFYGYYGILMEADRQSASRCT